MCCSAPLLAQARGPHVVIYKYVGGAEMLFAQHVSKGSCCMPVAA